MYNILDLRIKQRQYMNTELQNTTLPTRTRSNALHEMIRELYLAGRVDTEIASELNIAVSTVRGICRSPLFQASIREELVSLDQDVDHKLRIYTVQALDTLGSTLRNAGTSQKLKVSAARAILQSSDAAAARKVREKEAPVDIASIVRTALETAQKGAAAAQAALDTVAEQKIVYPQYSTVQDAA